MSKPIDIARANFKARQELVAELRSIDEAAEGRAYTDDEKSTVVDKRSSLEAVDERIAANLEMQARGDQITDATAALLGQIADQESGELRETRSMGRQFVESEQFRSFAATGGSGNQFPRVEYDGMELRAVTNTTLGTTSGGALARPALQGRIGQDFIDRKVYLLDLLPHIATTDTAVVYVQDKSPLADLANKAIEVTEGSAKPQAGATFAVVTEPIATIAAWAQLTRQVAADVPQMQGYLDNRLRYSLKRRSDIELIGGNGTPPNLLGLNGRTGITTYAPGSAEARYVSIRHAITLMEATEVVPEIIVLNPADAELFDLSNSTSAGLHSVMSLNEDPIPGAYDGDSVRRTAWGLTQVHSNAITAGTALLIDPTAVTVFDRQSATAYLTDSHASNFISNILTLLLECRLGVALWNPLGVALVTFNGAA